LHQGIEYSIRYAFSDRLKIRAGGTSAKHSYLRYSEGSNNYDGLEMDAAPRWLANSEITYYPSFLKLKDFHIALEWQHMGPYYLDPANTEKYAGFDVMNLRIGGTVKGIEAWLNVLNLANELYATHSAKSAYGKQYSAGEPRTFSIGLGYHINRNRKSSN
ncbi:MAG TPA: TonB-dependent receptor, partial [Anseongella sp.]|nr:TonB-dependent receptor [Anseongella sp.]